MIITSRETLMMEFLQRMSSDRGAGAYLKKRLGGGKEVHCYGGSFTLADASIKNTRLEKKGTSYNDKIDREYTKHLRTNIREKQSLRDTLQRLEDERRSVGYFEDEEGHLGLGRSTTRHGQTGSAPIAVPRGGQDYSPLVARRQLAGHGRHTRRRGSEGQVLSTSPCEDWSKAAAPDGGSPRVRFKQSPRGSPKTRGLTPHGSPKMQGASPQGSPKTQLARLKLPTSTPRSDTSSQGYDSVIDDAKLVLAEKYGIVLDNNGGKTSRAAKK